MSKENAAAREVVAAGLRAGAGIVDYVPAPHFVWEVEHLRPVNGQIVTLGRDTGQNVVVNLGAAHLLNVLFGSTRVSTAGAFLQLHSATTASNHGWNNISASQVASYGNNVPQLTFATVNGVRSASQSASYGFNAGIQTVSGACVQFYTTNTMSTNAATADILHYSEGLFGLSRVCSNGDTLNVTVTVTYGT